MASWVAKLTGEDGYVAEIELRDTAGPINQWRSRRVGAFGIEGDVFTNQTEKLVARGCGVTPCWVLYGFDIDTVAVGDEGNGDNNDAGGDMPPGSLTWKVIARL